jgi:transcription initiation factor TFIIIB Brf1 subunit/transcription initiation factor TFIIB
MEKIVCPYCHAHYLVWDEEVGQYYCSLCDMWFGNDELSQEAV